MNIKIILNGEKKIIGDDKNILQLIEDYKLNPMTVAVELNGKIIRRANFAQIKINDMDEIEIVKMMGGG